MSCSCRLREPIVLTAWSIAMAYAAHRAGATLLAAPAVGQIDRIDRLGNVHAVGRQRHRYLAASYRVARGQRDRTEALQATGRWADPRRRPHITCPTRPQH